MDKKPKGQGQHSAIDLFCGCGGLTVGLKEAGFKVLGAVDIDTLSMQTYKANHPEVTTWEKDIREINPFDVMTQLHLGIGELDLLAGCPPCQGFSTMRTLNGAFNIDDPRNDLLAEFSRFVEAFRPRSIMMENVPGLAKNRRFAEFTFKMKDLGYKGNHNILNTAAYGVPQRRLRLIYMAGHGAIIKFAPQGNKCVTVQDAIGNMPQAGKSGDPLHDLPEKRSPKVLERISKIPKNGGSRKDLPEEFKLDCHKICTGFKDVYGRMAWESVAPTITGGCYNPSKGRFLHPDEDRAITMREAALLQGFPPEYRFPISNNKTAIALMIGNALPPPFIAAHAFQISKFLSDSTSSFKL